MGQYDNLLGRIGFLACVDVVVEFWLAAGLSLPALLREVAEESPAWFSMTRSNGSTYTVIEAFDAQVTTRSGREVEARSRTTGRFGRLPSP